MDDLSRHLKKSGITYEDDVQILIEAKSKFPKLFAHHYKEEFQESTALIAEEEPLYLVEKENDYRDHLLPLIDELAIKSTYFDLLTTTAHLLINEDIETISFLEGKQLKQKRE